MLDLKEANFIDQDKIGPRDFNLMQSPDTDDMRDFFGYARYINFKGDSDYLTQMSLAALERKKKAVEDTDEEFTNYLDDIFPKPVSLENELESWYLLLWKVQDAIDAYPTSLVEDGEILIKHRDSPYLTYNQMNCIRLRFNDKVILESLKQTGINIIELAGMTRRNAIEHLIENPLLYKKSMKYVQDVFIPLLANPGEEENEMADLTDDELLEIVEKDKEIQDQLKEDL